jgi:hypothetical protein
MPELQVYYNENGLDQQLPTVYVDCTATMSFGRF